MARLIDADKLEKDLMDMAHNELMPDYFRQMCMSMAERVSKEPTIEAEPVRHGYWIDKFGDGDLYCSECDAVMEKHEHINHNLYYCYHCGAKMDKEESK